MARLVQRTVVTISQSELVDLTFSLPKWTDLAQGAPNDGIVRHGVDAIDKPDDMGYRIGYEKHVEAHVARSGSMPSTLLVWGARNAFQNLGLPCWHSARTPRLLRRADEPWRSWTYQALCKFESGAVGISAVTFVDVGHGEPDRIEIRDRGLGEHAAVEWAVTGQPLLWDGEITPLGLLAACTYDLRHIWRLQWEDKDGSPADVTAHTELMAVFMDLLDATVQDRAAELVAIAARRGLAVTDSYLHSSIGIRDDGSLVLVMAHGSLPELGRAHRELGSRRAILLDNGGSVGLTVWPSKDVAMGRVARHAVGNASYFRPKGHAVLIAEVAGDLVEGPLGPSPSGLSPWRAG